MMTPADNPNFKPWRGELYRVDVRWIGNVDLVEVGITHGGVFHKLGEVNYSLDHPENRDGIAATFASKVSGLVMEADERACALNERIEAMNVVLDAYIGTVQQIRGKR